MRILGWPATAVLATCAVFGLTGCKPNEAIKRGAVIDKGTKPSEAEPPKAAAIDPSTTGTLVGTVHFSGKAPERLKIDMSQDPVCSITGGDNLAEQYVVHGGKQLARLAQRVVRCEDRRKHCGHRRDESPNSAALRRPRGAPRHISHPAVPRHPRASAPR